MTAESQRLQENVQEIRDKLHHQDRRLDALEHERQDFRAATTEMHKARDELTQATRDLATLTERLDGSRSHAAEQIGALWGQHRAMDGRLRHIEQQMPVVTHTSERNQASVDKGNEARRRMVGTFIGGLGSGLALAMVIAAIRLAMTGEA